MPGPSPTAKSLPRYGPLLRAHRRNSLLVVDGDDGDGDQQSVVSAASGTFSLRRKRHNKQASSNAGTTISNAKSTSSNVSKGGDDSVATNNSRSSKRSSKSQKSKSSAVAVTSVSNPATADEAVVQQEVDEAREEEGDSITRASKKSTTSATAAQLEAKKTLEAVVREEEAEVATPAEEDDARCSAEPPVSTDDDGKSKSNNNDDDNKFDVTLSFSDKIDQALSDLAGKSFADDKQSTLEQNLEITYEHFLEFEQLRKEHIRHAHDALEQATLTGGSFMKVREVKAGDLHIEEGSDPAAIVEAEKEDVKKKDVTRAPTNNVDRDNLPALTEDASATASIEAPTNKVERLRKDQSPPTKAMTASASSEVSLNKATAAKKAESSDNDQSFMPKTTIDDQEAQERLLKLRKQNNVALAKMKLQVKQIKAAMDKRKRESVRFSRTVENQMEKNLIVLEDALEQQEKIEKEFTEKQEKHMKTEWKSKAFGRDSPLEDPVSDYGSVISSPSVEAELVSVTSVTASAPGVAIRKRSHIREENHTKQPSASSTLDQDGRSESEKVAGNTGETAYPAVVLKSKDVETAWNELVETAQDLRFTFSDGTADDSKEDSVSVGSDKTESSFSKFRSYVLQRKKSKRSCAEGKDNSSLGSEKTSKSASKFKSYLMQREKSAVSKQTPSPSLHTQSNATLPTLTDRAGGQNIQAAEKVTSSSRNLVGARATKEDGMPQLTTLDKEAWFEIPGYVKNLQKALLLD